VEGPALRNLGNRPMWEWCQFRQNKILEDERELMMLVVYQSFSHEKDFLLYPGTLLLSLSMEKQQ
jgi:hypothetical protein